MGDVRGEPVTKPGDLYQLGEHRLLCGDATEITGVERLLDGPRAAVVFTDPPYGVDYDGGTKKREKLAADNRGTGIYDDVLPVILLAAEEKAPLYLWHADRASVPVGAALAASNFTVRAQIIWVKNQAQFGALSAQYKQKHEPCFYAHRKGVAPYWYGPTNEVTVWEADRAAANDFHPPQKPIALAERALKNSSRVGDAVLASSVARARPSWRARCWTAARGSWRSTRATPIAAAGRSSSSAVRRSRKGRPMASAAPSDTSGAVGMSVRPRATSVSCSRWCRRRRSASWRPLAVTR